MLECEVEPNHVSLNAVLSSLEKGHRWQEAWSFLNCMPVQPDVISFTYAIKACQDSQAWQVALRILTHMKRVDVQPNSATYMSMISLG